jgi:hypothetical protein
VLLAVLNLPPPKTADLVRLRLLTGLRELDLHGIDPVALPGLVRFHP